MSRKRITRIRRKPRVWHTPPTSYLTTGRPAVCFALLRIEALKGVVIYYLFIYLFICVIYFALLPFCAFRSLFAAANQYLNSDNIHPTVPKVDAQSHTFVFY